MPTGYSPVDISNLALSRIGAESIQALNDNQSVSAIACNQNWPLAYLSVSRCGAWNALLAVAILAQQPQTPIPGDPAPSPVVAWAPLTAYTVGQYLSYGSPAYIYVVMFSYTSTVSFANDLTTGALTQTNEITGIANFFQPDGSQFPSGWAYKYALPADFQLLVSLNANTGLTADNLTDTTDDYEIIGTSLYCDTEQAIIQYVQNQPDSSRFDAMFVDALSYKLAAMIATTLRQDGGKLAGEMLSLYNQCVRTARQKNGGEKQRRRFNPINSSRYIQSRYGGLNG